MKILALDIGDKWIGSAISDPLHITCRPLETTTSENLYSFLQTILSEHNIEIVIIGCPTTMKGEKSSQTKKVINIKEQLEQKFQTINSQNITWLLWDERLSSKRAQGILGKKFKTKKGKIEEHSLAAAFILQSYLDYQKEE